VPNRDACSQVESSLTQMLYRDQSNQRRGGIEADRKMSNIMTTGPSRLAGRKFCPKHEVQKKWGWSCAGTTAQRGEVREVEGNQWDWRFCLWRMRA